MTPRPPNARDRGFTLVEMSVVLAVIALVTAMAVQSGYAVITTARLSATQQKMAAIDKALQAYRTSYDRLPCPGNLTLASSSANYGLEANAGTGSSIAVGVGTCTGGTPAANNTAAGITNTMATAAEGAVPTVTLGLPNDFMYDGWGKKFRYAVDISFTALGAFPGAQTGCVTGALTLYDSTGSTARSKGAIYALISHGANGHGAYTLGSGSTMVNGGSSNANELVNCHCNSSGAASTYAATYVQQDPGYQSGHAGTAAYYFDDIVTYKERWQMLVAWDKITGACTGYAYVGDNSYNRVEIFSSGGTYPYKSQMDCASGSCAGAIGNPNGVAIDRSGNIWIANGGYNNITEWSWSGSRNGTLLKTLPSTCTPSCAGTLAAGSFNGPEGIAFDPNGSLWVADENNNRVQKINPSTGSMILAIGAGYQGVGGSPGSCGTLAGQFDVLQYVKSDTAGSVYATEYGGPCGGATRIQKFDGSTGAAITQWTTITGYGMLSTVDDIAFDSNGSIWIADEGAGNLVRFNPATGTATGSVPIPTAGGLQAMDVDSSGSVWVSDERFYNIYIVNPASLTWNTIIGGGTSGAGSFSPVPSFALTNGTAASIAASR